MSFISNVVRIAEAEWAFFGQQAINVQGVMSHVGRRETDSGVWERIGVYWLEGTGNELDGRNTEQPWSAAFISWIMRKAGAGPRFRYSSAHSTYIRQAIDDAKSNNVRAGFVGKRIETYPPKVGDLVCYAREPGIDFDTTKDSFRSHGDLVVAVRDGELDVIGGNVADSVTKKTLSLSSTGLLIDTRHAWFAALENLMDADALVAQAGDARAKAA